MWWAFPLTLWRSLFCHNNRHLLFRSFLNEALRFFILLRCINKVLTLKFWWHYGIERNIVVSMCEKPKFERFMYRSNRDINILPGIPWEFDKRMYRGRSVTSEVAGRGRGNWHHMERVGRGIWTNCLETILRREDRKGQSSSFVNVFAGDNSLPKVYAVF